MIDMALLYGEYYTRDAPALASVYAQGAITEADQHLDILPVIKDMLSFLETEDALRRSPG